MKLFLRNIKNNEHPVEVEATDTAKKLFDAADVGFPGAGYSGNDAILLIFKGKILTEEQTIGDLGLKDEDRIVIMTRKKKELGKRKAPAKKEEPAPAPAAAPAAPAAAVPAPEKKAEAPAAAAPAAAAPAATPAAEAEPEASDLTEEQEAMVTTLVGMGFSRHAVVSVLKMSDWNVDRAGQLLLEMAEDDMADMAEEQAAGGAGASLAMGEVPTGTSLPEDHPLYEFVTSDIFQEMRRAVREDPSSMVNYIMEMVQSNPEMAQEVMAHEHDFMSELLGSSELTQMLLQGGAGGAQGGERDAAMLAAQQQMQASLANIEAEFSPEDNEAIQRLMEVTGMPKHICIEAYMACDKNEQYAANFLFDQI